MINKRKILKVLQHKVIPGNAFWGINGKNVCFNVNGSEEAEAIRPQQDINREDNREMHACEKII